MNSVFLRTIAADLTFFGEHRHQIAILRHAPFGSNKAAAN
jgi:hypothetical protein